MRVGDPSDGQHFCCSMTATLIARVRRVAGDDAVPRLLREAGSTRTAEHLADIGNWISYDEAIALLEAGVVVTGDRDFAWHVGSDTVLAVGSSMTAEALRRLGSPEALLGQMAVASHRFSTVASLEALEVEPGRARIRAVANAGHVRHRLHCEWTAGLLSTTTELFGRERATVAHESCQAEGDPDCRYHLTWPAAAEDEAAVLRRQLKAMSDRLESVFATAADLIASGDIDETLARITARAAHQVRAPRHLLAIRPTPDSDVRWHQKGFAPAEAAAVAERVLAADRGELPEHWLVAEVRSHRHHYGSLVAVYQPGATFFPQERRLLEVYARYAATALDTATALMQAQQREEEARRRYEESRALLELAREVAAADSSDKIAARLADAVPAVVDCDRVSVYLWDDERRLLVRRVVSGERPGDESAGWATVRPEDAPQLAEWLVHPNPEPVFVDFQRSPIAPSLREVGAEAAVVVPIATGRRLLGCLIVAVLGGAERLACTPELRDRLSGVAAHAVAALENGRLVDHITHLAIHDPVTGLANRSGLSRRLARVADAEAPAALFYVDLDRFKPVNDSFGHDVGDGLLRATAARLRERVRPTDTVARIGGDEFVVLVEDIESPEQIEHITARLEDAFTAPLAVGGQTFPISASIGRAVWPLEVADHRDLVTHADAAMYRAKRAKFPARHALSGA